MIFPETARPGLAVRKRRMLILPGSSFGSVSQTIPFFLILFIYVSTSHRKYKEPPMWTAQPYKFFVNLCLRWEIMMRCFRKSDR